MKRLYPAIILIVLILVVVGGIHVVRVHSDFPPLPQNTAEPFPAH